MLNVFRQILIWLLIVAAVSLAVDYLRRPALPQNFSSMPLQTLDGRTVDLAAMSHERPLLLYVWATWCGVCRYTTVGGRFSQRWRQCDDGSATLRRQRRSGAMAGA